MDAGSHHRVQHLLDEGPAVLRLVLEGCGVSVVALDLGLELLNPTLQSRDVLVVLLVKIRYGSQCTDQPRRVHLLAPYSRLQRAETRKHVERQPRVHSEVFCVLAARGIIKNGDYFVL